MKNSKTVLITGASGLVGMGICKHLSFNNWNIVVASTSYEKAEQVKSTIGGQGKVTALELDLLDQQSIETVIDRLVNEKVPLTHIVNNARSLETLLTDDDGFTSAHNFLKEFELSIVQPYRFLCALKKRKVFNINAIVNISSQYGITVPNPNLYEDPDQIVPINYGVVKASLNQVTKELAVRLAPENTRVNAVAFGGFSGRETERFNGKYSKMLPIKRMLEPEEAGPPVEFLLDDAKSSSITGHVLVADGGWTIT